MTQVPYGKSVDWWTFGIFIYELNLGKPPFIGENQKDLYNSILSRQFTIPKTFSSNLSDICLKLIESDVSKRLGCLKGHSNDVRDHKWFSQTNWMGILDQIIVAPYLPKQVEPLDIAFKNSKKTEEPLKICRKDRYKSEFSEF